MMKKPFLILSMLFMSGCINLYTRCPFTDIEVERPWQSTRAAVGMSYVVMFPQALSPANSQKFIAANLVSVPVGCLCWVDVICEAVIDTMLWPVDAAKQRLSAAL